VRVVAADDALRGFAPLLFSRGPVGLGRRLRAYEAELAAELALRAHLAHPTRYERELKIPAAAAYAHRRGTRWKQSEMCAAQWQRLTAIRARDRERRRGRREEMARR
jgi:hypothetical protein